MDIKKFNADFYINTLRLKVLIDTNEELSLKLKNKYPSEAPDYLMKAYTDFNAAIEQLIKAEAKFLVNLI